MEICSCFNSVMSKFYPESNNIRDGVSRQLDSHRSTMVLCDVLCWHHTRCPSATWLRWDWWHCHCDQLPVPQCSHQPPPECRPVPVSTRWAGHPLDSGSRQHTVYHGWPRCAVCVHPITSPLYQYISSSHVSTSRDTRHAPCHHTQHSHPISLSNPMTQT